MYLQFTRNVASMSDYSVHRNAQVLGNLLVAHTLHQRHYNILLAFTQSVSPLLVPADHIRNLSRHITLPRPLLQRPDSRNKNIILHLSVQRKPLLIIIYVIKRSRKLVVTQTVTREVLDDDTLQLPQLRTLLTMMLRVHVNSIISQRLSPD